uniref:Uncharacterized protein n=1 Tax=Anguilla anguilla TaxID=7936 RepID=A0A0E9VJW7_ANGAN
MCEYCAVAAYRRLPRSSEGSNPQLTPGKTGMGTHCMIQLVLLLSKHSCL